MFDYKSLRKNIINNKKIDVEPFIRRLGNGTLKRNLEKLNLARNKSAIYTQIPNYKKMVLGQSFELLMKAIGLVLIAYGIKDFLLPS